MAALVPKDRKASVENTDPLPEPYTLFNIFDLVFGTIIS
jgi:hypothetical protein